MILLQQDGFLTLVSSGESFRDGLLTDALFLPLLHDEIMFSFSLLVWHETLPLFFLRATFHDVFQVTSHDVFQAVFHGAFHAVSTAASLQVYATPSPMIF